MAIGSNRSRAVLYAAQVGYLVEPDGTVFSPHGSPMRTRNDSGYARFNVNLPSSVEPDRTKRTLAVYVHKLMAYQKFGTACFGKGIHVRHLNGDSLDNSAENIAIGNQSDNMMDQPKSIRRARSLHAASFIKKLTPPKVLAIKADRKSGMSYAEIMQKHGLAKSTVWKAIKS